jgi:alkanesulfonate monooxygenase SsuD/methylene tetrahydromethanopterin reductase-like flavin-dependent oxidoreductase (luciferase family)
MRLGLLAGQFGPDITINFDLIKEAERLGYSSVWTAEAYGNDAIVPLSFIAANTTTIGLGTAIMQMPARSPAMTAMTAMTLDKLSGGRFNIGIGPSGPQVVEGWHGVPYGRPLTPLKSILHGRADMKIYTAAISPRGLECAGEVADGVFPVWLNPERTDLIEGPVETGLATAGGGKARGDFDLAPFVTVILGDDVEMCRGPVKAMLALYIGGMGARGKNFYNDYAKRLGYEEAATKIQDLYLDGKRAEAMAAVPDTLVDETALVGPRERIADRIEAWKASSVDTMLLGAGQPEALQAVAELVL